MNVYEVKLISYTILLDICVKIITLFFFSSRRRHTRCSRDWSSDVCSSDLPRRARPRRVRPPPHEHNNLHIEHDLHNGATADHVIDHHDHNHTNHDLHYSTAHDEHVLDEFDHLLHEHNNLHIEHDLHNGATPEHALHHDEHNHTN